MRDVIEWEGYMIVQLHRLAEVQAKLMRQLARGCVESEVVGATMDLHNIANRIRELVVTEEE